MGMEAGATMSKLDRKIETAKADATAKLVEHERLAEEMAAIQKELERRVSLGKQPHGGKPWTPRGSSS